MNSAHNSAGKKTRRRNQRATALEAEQRVAARSLVNPRIEYPEALPVSAARADIAAALKEHQVIVVAGETGSGKTTQLPKLCMELGYGIRGLIGHTQPRRIAARSVAARLAEETGLELGHGIGYQVRFTSETDNSTRVKVMTDGILLAELQREARLSQYEVIIIDEAHERSLNIDFLMGFLAQLLPERPDLKVIITSATIDPESFAQHFDQAPIIRVPGRTYPVEVRYRPLNTEESRSDDDIDGPGPDGDYEIGASDQIDGVLAAVDELALEDPGDILVFLSGEREIRDTAQALHKHMLGYAPHTSAYDIVPLYGRLSSAEQNRVFAPHTGARIVLATNVAETSLTVPGIKYVIDAGTARISRYSNRTKVQRLPIEAISQASARQRAGRAGRTSPGICIRLYSEQDFESRPEYTDPEILRTHLASVVLQMLALRLVTSVEDILAFPFLTKPEPKAVRDGIALLSELGALTVGEDSLKLTRLGSQLGRLPIDPRMARMILAGAKNGVGEELTVIVAALSLQDPRERPVDHRGEADAKHARFNHPASDFLSLLALWNYLSEAAHTQSSSKFRKLCKAEFLNFVRIREWQDTVAQLRSMLGQVGVRISRPGFRLGTDQGTGQGTGQGQLTTTYSATEERIHRSLLTGLLNSIGQLRPEGKEYAGVRGTRMRIFPGSSLFGTTPELIVAAELVETSRLWARTVAKIEPEWVIEAAGTLIRHQYSEPHWSEKAGQAFVYDRMSLYGLVLSSDQRVGYGTVDPVHAREMFIRHALVEGQWREHHAFIKHNARMLKEAAELANRMRDHRLLTGEDALYALYDRVLPDTITSAGRFNSWWKKTRRENPEALNLDPAALVPVPTGDTNDKAASDFPLQWELLDYTGAKLGSVDGHGKVTSTAIVRYYYEPGQDRDGVTVHMTKAQALLADPAQFSWQVPGLRHELVTALIRTLPKAKRRYFVPAPNVATAVLAELEPYQGSLPEKLAEALSARAGGGELTDLVPITVQSSDFDLTRLPGHLRMTFEVQLARGKKLRGTDLPQLITNLSDKPAPGTATPDVAHPARGTNTASAPSAQTSAPDSTRQEPNGTEQRFVPVQGATGWTFGTVAKTAGHAHVALIDEGSSVGLGVCEDEQAAQRTHVRGLARLLSLGAAEARNYALSALSTTDKAALDSCPDYGAAAVVNDAVFSAIYGILKDSAAQSENVRSFADYSRLERFVNEKVLQAVEQKFVIVVDILRTTRAIEKLVAKTSSLAVLVNIANVKAELATLVYPGFIADRAPQYVDRTRAYALALLDRTQKLGIQTARDKQFMDRLANLTQQVDRVIQTVDQAELATFTRHPATVANAVQSGSDALPEDIQELVYDLAELRISLWAPHVKAAHPVSEQRINKRIKELLKARQ